MKLSINSVGLSLFSLDITRNLEKHKISMDRSIARAAVNLNGSPAVGRDPALLTVPSIHCAEQEMIAPSLKYLSKFIFRNKVNCPP